MVDYSFSNNSTEDVDFIPSSSRNYTYKTSLFMGLSNHVYKILVMSPLNNGNSVIMKQIALPNK